MLAAIDTDGGSLSLCTVFKEHIDVVKCAEEASILFQQ